MCIRDSGYLYYQEFGEDDGSTAPTSAITAYVESSQLSIGSGDKFVFLKRLIPDITFDGSSTDEPTLEFTLKSRRFPGASYHSSETGAVTQTATVPVEQFTNEKNIRLRGRSFALRVESDDLEVMWRLGTPRVDIREDGRR